MRIILSYLGKTMLVKSFLGGVTMENKQKNNSPQNIKETEDKKKSAYGEETQERSNSKKTNKSCRTQM